MARKELLDKISTYIPQPKQDLQLVERLLKLGEKKDRSVKYLVFEAILEYLDQEEQEYIACLSPYGILLREADINEQP